MSPPVPALPRDRFSAFKAFVTTPPEKEWPCGDDHPWRWAKAAGVAIGVAHALGAFGVVSAPVADLTDEAFAWWLSIHGTAEWLAQSRRAILLANHPDQQPGAFAFGSRAFGWDRGTWPLTNGELVRRLNTWCRTALTAFYAVAASAEDPAQLKLALAATEDPSATRPEIPPAPEGIDAARWRVVWPVYVAHVEEFRAAHKRPPKKGEDEEWWSRTYSTHNNRPAITRNDRSYITRDEMRAARGVWRGKNLKKSSGRLLGAARPC